MNKQCKNSDWYYQAVRIPVGVSINSSHFKKRESVFNMIKYPVVKLAALILIISLNWAGLSAVIETIAYFNNTENSSGNVFQAGVLDFELQSSGDFPAVCFGEPAERIISITNYGNPFKYKASSTEFSGEVCDYVNLKANLGDELKYNGPLEGFSSDIFEFSDPEDWTFETTFNSDLPSELLGQTCTFKFVFDGSQTKNDLPFGQGFSDKEEITSSILAKACCWTEIRSCGYWKNHSDVYKYHLPQTLGGYPTDEIVNTVTKANNILEAACGTCGCGCDKTMRTKLKGQLLAMKFNIDHFGIGLYVDATTTPKTLNDIVAEADNLLRNPDTPNSVLEEMKDLLDYLNNLGQIPFCSETPPDECQLQLTKTATNNQVAPGETITYHLTFDNIGGKVCTGGGVRLKDIFNKTELQYINYTSTRKPNYFSQGYGYLEWNFGSIYPDDPLIEVDLNMKAASSTQCDYTIINSAKYWSNETDWGEPVTANVDVVCESAPAGRVVINEFLPNPVGNDNAPKPNGEWVELYNTSTSDIDVVGWVLYDSNDGHELPITAANTNTGDTVVGANGFLVVYRDGDSDFALNNTDGDSVRLYDGEIGDGANLIDSHTYTINAAEGKSFARIPDGSETWVDPIPTPGEPNVIGDEETVFGEAVAEEGEDGYIEIPVEEEIVATEEAEATPTEEVVIEEVAVPIQDDSIGNGNEPSGNENEPEPAPVVEPQFTTGQGIVEQIDEIIDEVVEEIIEEVTPDEVANEAIEEPAEIPAEGSVETQVNDEQVFEEPPAEEVAVIEQAPVVELLFTTGQVPATEEQPVIAPESNNTDVAPSNGDGSEAVSGNSSSASASEAPAAEAPATAESAPAAAEAPAADVAPAPASE